MDAKHFSRKDGGASRVPRGIVSGIAGRCNNLPILEKINRCGRHFPFQKRYGLCIMEKYSATPDAEGVSRVTADSSGTARFMPIAEGSSNAADILEHVYRALQAKGYDPVTQIVGYLISGDPTYITSHNQARSMITRLERDEIVEEIVRVYLRRLDA